MVIPVSAGGLGLDQLQLVRGAVDEHDPRPPMAVVTGFGLVKSACNDRGGVIGDRAGQPLAPRLRSGAERAVPVPATGRGDHIVRAAGGRFGVVDAG